MSNSIYSDDLIDFWKRAYPDCKSIEELPIGTYDGTWSGYQLTIDGNKYFTPDGIRGSYKGTITWNGKEVLTVCVS